MDRRSPPRLRICLALGLVLALLAPPALADLCPPVPLDPPALPAVSAALRARQPITITAFGSSSTRGSGASDETASYPARLEAALRAFLPGVTLRVFNRGVGGEDAAEMLARLDADVIADRPQLVIWQAGGNGALRGRDPEQFGVMLREGIARLHRAGADVMLMDSQRAPRITAAPSAPRFESMMSSVARTARAALFPRGRLMDSWAAAGVPHAELLIADGLHHNDRGYACVAEALARNLLAALADPALHTTRGPFLTGR